MLYGWICWVGTKDLEKQMLMQSNGGLFDLKALFHFSDALFLLAVSPVLLHITVGGSRVIGRWNQDVFSVLPIALDPVVSCS